jgi:hypothetical protein
MDEHTVFARFRYNDLKEAARNCGGRGPYAHSMVGRIGVERWRGCAVERDVDSMNPDAGCCEKSREERGCTWLEACQSAPGHLAVSHRPLSRMLESSGCDRATDSGFLFSHWFASLPSSFMSM